MQILGVEATSDDVHDGEVFDQLIDVIVLKCKILNIFAALTISALDNVA